MVDAAVILTVALYGCETWSFTLREERRLRMLQDRAMRRIFGLKRDEVTGEWRKLQNEELKDLYCSLNTLQVITSRIRWVGHVVSKGERRVTCRVLVGRTGGKRIPARPRYRWEDNVKMDLQEVEWCMDWIDLAQDRKG